MSRKRGKLTPKKHHINLRVIPEPAPATRSVLIRVGSDALVIRGAAAPNVVMDCGSCGVRLVDGVAVSQLASLVLKCNACGAFNETVEG